MGIDYPALQTADSREMKIVKDHEVDFSPSFNPEDHWTPQMKKPLEYINTDDDFDSRRLQRVVQQTVDRVTSHDSQIESLKQIFSSIQLDTAHRSFDFLIEELSMVFGFLVRKCPNC